MHQNVFGPAGELELSPDPLSVARAEAMGRDGQGER